MEDFGLETQLKALSVAGSTGYSSRNMDISTEGDLNCGGPA